MELFFSDYFDVNPQIIEDYGAFNISLVTDLPLFIDPFLLFNSRKANYQMLHNQILRYLRFLRDKSQAKTINKGLLKAWYQFPEIKQNWLGYCKKRNRGKGLGLTFALALHRNLYTIFSDFGTERITRGSHLEKLCLIKDGVGRDNISDFTTNLIHEYLLEYTQEFTVKHIKPEFRIRKMISNVRFNYTTESWERDMYELPDYDGDYVLLTPKDLLTREDTWINRSELIDDFEMIPDAIPNDELRAEINNYFHSVLSEEPSKKECREAVEKVLDKWPIIMDYFIKIKEENGELAVISSTEKVFESKQLYFEQFKILIDVLEKNGFYRIEGNTFEESMNRVLFLKDVIENNDGYKVFYLNSKPIKREEDLQILYRLTWFSTPSDVNREVNNGRGPVDFKISRGDKDKTLIEFKLASNTQLKKNLMNQVKIYEKANKTANSIKVILYFSEAELNKVNKILNDTKLNDDRRIILIDARNDNKPSASKAG